MRCYGDVARAAPKKASRIYRNRESQIRVPQPRTAFHLHAQQTLSVVTMRVSNPDCSPFKVQRVFIGACANLGAILRCLLRNTYRTLGQYHASVLFIAVYSVRVALVLGSVSV